MDKQAKAQWAVDKLMQRMCKLMQDFDKLGTQNSDEKPENQLPDGTAQDLGYVGGKLQDLLRDSWHIVESDSISEAIQKAVL